jgi:hypothetical protein
MVLHFKMKSEIFCGAYQMRAAQFHHRRISSRRRLHRRRRNFNRLLAGARVAVEHTLASVKRLRILHDEIRDRRAGMVAQVMAIGCTLHNFRWESRQRALAA